MVEAFRLTVGTLKHPGPGFVPMIASAGILVSCLVVLFQAKNTPKGNDKNPPAKSKDRYKVLILRASCKSLRKGHRKIFSGGT